MLHRNDSPTKKYELWTPIRLKYGPAISRAYFYGARALLWKSNFALINICMSKISFNFSLSFVERKLEIYYINTIQ